MAREERDERDKDERGTEIHLDLGLGNIFKGLGGFLDLLANMENSGQTDYTQKGLIRGNERSKLRGVYGFNVHLGADGPRVSEFGNVRPQKGGPVFKDTREPLVDLFDEGAEIVAVVELPGVAEDAIAVRIEGQTLSIRAADEVWRYHKDLPLQEAVRPETLHTRYRNGILELRVQKVSSQPEGGTEHGA